MKTIQPKNIERNWHIIDASGVRLGKLATNVAVLLRGKNKVIYTPNVDCGDHVIVINAEKVDIHSDKLSKSLYHHSGYPGGLTAKTYKTLLSENPIRIIEHAVNGMLPGNRLSGVQIRRLRVYRDANYRETAQKPQNFEIKKQLQN